MPADIKLSLDIINFASSHNVQMGKQQNKGSGISLVDCMKDKLLTDKIYKIEKFAGKGGWTIVKLPEIKIIKKVAFGWLTVKGQIDNVEIRNFKLQSMGNGVLFLSLNAHLKKKIKKQEGDFVHILLYEDNKQFEIPEELNLCLSFEPNAYSIFYSYKDNKQKAIVEWIYSAKSEDLKIERMAQLINDLLKK